MSDLIPESKPETLDATCTFGGRRPSSCSPDDAFLGLFFQPFWYVGLAMAVVSVFIETWSPLCFIGGILAGGAVAKCAMQANRENVKVELPPNGGSESKKGVVGG